MRVIPNSVGDKLHLIFHAGGQGARLRIAVDVDFLRPACDDEDRDLTRLEHASPEDIHMSYIQNFSV